MRVIDVSVGEAVRAGQTLAELDRASLGAALQAARADVQATGSSATAASVQSAAVRVEVAAGKLTTLESGGPAALNSRIAAQSAARQAALKVQADRAAVTREEELLAAGVVAGKDAEAARSQLASDEADQRAADAKSAAAGTDFQSALKQAQADVASARSDLQAARGQAASAQARLVAARIAYANGALDHRAGRRASCWQFSSIPVKPSIRARRAVELGPAFGRGVTLTGPGANRAPCIAVGDPVTLRR